jgi:murein DD-endopeptidase MepM/ murein hydrolase activator NlpD
MEDNRYMFDPENLKFEEQDQSFKKKFFRMFFGLLMSGIVIAFILLLVSSYVIVSPSTRKKIRENEKLKQELRVLTKRFLQTEKVLEDIKKRDENIYKVIMESDPYTNEEVDDEDNLTETLSNAHDVDDIEIAGIINHQLDSLFNYIAKDEKAFNNFAKVVETKEKMLASIPSIQPVKNDDLEVIVYGFGKRIDPFYRTPAFHSGMDYSVPEGTKVYATADGKIKYAANKRGEGKMIVINHGYGFITKYSHLSKLLVAKGKKVKRGDVIGLSGNTGKSMSPHLHYEVLLNNEAVNPVNFYFADLDADQYNTMIRRSSRGGLSLD